MSTKPIEIVIPAANTAADWNTAIKEGAEKAGVELPAPGAAAPDAAATAAAAAKKDDEVIYRATLNVGGKEMVFEGKDAADVLKQYSTAVGAAQLATPAAPAAAAVVEEKKPAFSEAELFDISMGLQKGDAKVLDNYILKSGVLDLYLESKGVKIDDLKSQVTERQSDKLADRWEQATKDFTAKIKAGQSDYPGGAQNTYLMGITLAELGLREKPSVESFELAYAKMKERGIVYPVTAAAAAAAAAEEVKPKKEATSSTAVGSHGGKADQHVEAPKKPVELDITQLSTRQYTESYNELRRRGYTPEQIIIKS